METTTQVKGFKLKEKVVHSIDASQVHINSAKSSVINSVDFTADVYFPDMGEFANNVLPQDGKILLQVQYQPPMMGTILMIDDMQKAEGYQKSLCKVLSMGSNAFISKSTGRVLVPDVKVGTYIVAPLMQGRRFKTKHPIHKESWVHFILCDDSDVEAIIKDPMIFINNLEK